MTGPVRIGAVLGPGAIPRWQRSLLDSLESLPDCILTTWVGEPTQGRALPTLPSAVFRRYERWDRARFRQDGDPVAAVDPPTAAGREPEEQDALLWLTDAPLPERSPAGLRLGVWFLRQGAARADRDAPLFAELRAGSGTVVTSLRALVGERERVLLRSVGPCDRLSLHRSRVRAYSKAAQLPGRCLRQIARGEPAQGEAAPPSPPARAPTAADTAELLARIAWRRLRRDLRARLFESQWLVAYRSLKEPVRPLSLQGRYRTLLPPRGRSFADPFPCRHQGKRAILFEDFPTRAGKGTIAAVTLDADGRPSVPETVLDRAEHLSYPFLLTEGDDLFMLPESRQARRVELLRATAFPWTWGSERMLMEDVPATDATLLTREGRLWLFAAIAADEGAAVDELFLFSAPSLESEWIPHPRNPVVSDVRRARPAGALFEHDGQLFRPAQDCSRAYGWRVVVNRVELLSQSHYREVPVGRIEPVGRALARTHTYNVSAGVETLDAMRLAPRWRALRSAPKTVEFRFVRLPEA